MSATGVVGPEIAIPVHHNRVGQADYPGRFTRHPQTEAPPGQVKVLRPDGVLEL